MNNVPAVSRQQAARTIASIGNQRPRCYVLPSLGFCRELFADKIGQTIDWGDGWELEKWQYADAEPARRDGSNWDPDTGFWAKRAEKPPF